MKLHETLPEVRIASPCHARWDEMKGDERARFCGQCQKHVYNLSAMTAEAAARLVREKEGKLCARFYQRADGAILHGEDCPAGLAVRQWRRVKNLAGAAASFVLLLVGASKAQAGDPTGEKKPPVQPTAPETPVMGRICEPLPPSPTPKPTATPKPK